MQTTFELTWLDIFGMSFETVVYDISRIYVLYNIWRNVTTQREVTKIYTFYEMVNLQCCFHGD